MIQEVIAKKLTRSFGAKNGKDVCADVIIECARGSSHDWSPFEQTIRTCRALLSCS